MYTNGLYSICNSGMMTRPEDCSKLLQPIKHVYTQCKALKRTAGEQAQVPCMLYGLPQVHQQVTCTSMAAHALMCCASEVDEAL
jgi:hypothetical protein